MTDKEIEKAERRAWVEEHFLSYGLSDEEVMTFNPLPSENFSEGFRAGFDFALSHQWISVEVRIPPGTTILLCTSLMQGDRATALCVYVRGKFMVYNGKITNREFYPTHWMPMPKFPIPQ